MKKKYFILLFICTSLLHAQQDAWVYLKDKPSASTFFNAPLKMLSQRALDRRSTQKIDLDAKDVPIESTYLNQIKSKSGVSVMATSKWLNAIHVRGTQTDLNTLKALPFIEKLDFANKALNKSAKSIAVKKEKNVSKTAKTKIEYAYGTSSNQIQMLNGHLLHQQNYTGSGKIIAVMDSGFPGVNSAQPFKRLIDNNQILGGYNYVLRNPDFYTGTSHGTSVLSTIGGFKENQLVGTAPDASYYLFITENDTSENPVEESLWVEAAEKADSLGVDIINTSLGYFDFDNTSYNHTYSEMDGKTAFMSRGAEIAFSRGMIVVSSAGNSGASSNPYIAVPADAVSVLAIGAVNANEIRTSFSSIGPSFDNRIKPDVMAQGQSAIISDPLGNIVTANGTSFSSPILTGLVACLWQALPNKTNKEIREIIIKSSDRFAAPNNLYGYGVPDFNAAFSDQLDLNEIAVNEVVIYPNPTADLLSLILPKNSTSGIIQFFNTAGQKVFEKKMENNDSSISIKELQTGLYSYKFQSQDFIKTGKIYKQ
ncbi:peptidase S8 [Flavobacterium sp. SOK18b]|uniref:S8 family peptidase n=1 Tax=Flavobacterium sp. SOK18b TaxID=797900 RepID=UPI0015F91841|nr:S8 family serine peptidase [Flavobacterium sp. SOK18b]MBB1194570.1 peptidase S8 [Flavobacterium sp. SOK18b]